MLSSVYNFNDFLYWKEITISIVLILVLTFYQLTKKDSRQENYLKNIPGPPSLPIIGSILVFYVPNQELMRVLLGLSKKYGNIFKIWHGRLPYIVISGAKEIEAILSSSKHIDKSREYDVLAQWLGNGLLTAKGKEWRPRRKLLTPAFHFKILEEFVDVFNEQATIFTNILQTKADGKSFDIFPNVTHCALDIICETAMGKKMNTQSGKELEYVKAVYGYGDIIIKKCLRPWLKIKLFYALSGYLKQENNYLKTLHNFTEKVIVERKFERKQNSSSECPLKNSDMGEKKRKAFLDLLLDVAEEENLTDLHIREETDTFMFEGHDTTAANMVWTIFTLGSYPEHQKRVQEELEEIFKDNRNPVITSADVSKMKYLECCIKETLRLYPSVPFYLRQLNEDCQMADGILIPKGVSVFISSISAHRDPKAFPDPETFNPNRFNTDNCINRNPYAYVPFSAGPRNCIGQKFAMLEEKIVLAKFFLNFNCESVEKPESVQMVPDLILRPFKGIYVKVTKRNAI